LDDIISFNGDTRREFNVNRKELFKELQDKFEKIIIIRNLQRTPSGQSLNPCSEIYLPPQNVIVPSYKENKINFNGISTDMNDFLPKYETYKRSKKIEELLNH